MTSILFPLVAVLALGGDPTRSAQSQRPGGAELDGSKLVQMRALAGQDGVRPGGRIPVYVHFEIEPQWHTYWENPGDSGLPTHLTVRAPAGFEVGPRHFSVPSRHEIPGDIVDFVHEKEQVVWFELTAPADAKPGKVRLEIDARWLVCIEVCLAGKGDTALEIPVLPSDREPKTLETDALKRWRALLPRPASELAGLMVRWQPTSDALELELTVAGAQELEYFPRSDDVLSMTGRTQAGDKLRVKLALDESKGARPKLARAVLRVRTHEEVKGYDLEIPLPEVPRDH